MAVAVRHALPLSQPISAAAETVPMNSLLFINAPSPSRLPPIELLIDFGATLIVIKLIRITHAGPDRKPECPLAVIEVDVGNGESAILERLRNPLSVPVDDAVTGKIGGKRQVPFIIDRDNKVEMYESDEIIEYLKTL